ncbi:MAG: formamidopyrimidine-DNA glycosylase [Deltaproteobacteria bacterium]|nr:formamidopyrimidine-DNA glycosylase [Deltaproteobacteria bacterium]
MPELPDVEAYVAAVAARVRGAPLLRIRVATPFLVRTAEPPLAEAEGKRVREVRRLGKRVVLALEGGLFLSIHLMIAGRLHWREPGGKLPRAGKPLCELEFPGGTLVLTEAGTRRRAALHLLRGEEALRALDRGGIEPLLTDDAAFAAALTRESHTLKRALTDPRLFSGIGNAYSDEILHRARLSPFRLSRQLDAAEVRTLAGATRAVLGEWRDRLLAEARGGFPEKVTAFREGFAVHGRHRQPCPACGAPVQRIVRAESECNYCPGCQTGGQILSDRSLARLLREDWPRTLEELERNPALGLRPAVEPVAKGGKREAGVADLRRRRRS